MSIGVQQSFYEKFTFITGSLSTQYKSKFYYHFIFFLVAKQLNIIISYAAHILIVQLVTDYSGDQKYSKAFKEHSKELFCQQSKSDS